MRGFPAKLIVCVWALCSSVWAQSLTLQWDPSPSTDVSGYNLYRSTTSGSGYARVNGALIPATTFIDSTLQYDTVYYYVCTAVNQAGLESGFSNEVQAPAQSPPVDPTNTPPQVQAQTASTSEDQPVTVDLLAGAHDPDGDTLRIQSVTQGIRGSVAILSTGSVRYTPSQNANGSDSFVYTVTDDRGGTASASVGVTILPVNDPPYARDDSATLRTRTPLTIQVLGNDTDVDGDVLTILSSTQPAHGTAAIVGYDRITYSLSDTSYRGQDRFEYVITDGQGAQSSAAVVVEIVASNDPPTAVDDVVSLKEDSKGTIDVVANDSDPDGGELTVTLVDLPKAGKARVLGNRVVYTPDPNFFGSDQFTYFVRDAQGEISGTAKVSIAVTPVNDPPDVRPDAAVTDPETTLDLAVLLNDDDPDGDSLEIERVSQPEHGQVSIQADGTLSYIPAEGFTGLDHFSYWVTDGAEDASAQVELEVTSEGETDPLLFPVSVSAGGPPFDDLFVGLALLNSQERFEPVHVRVIDAEGRAVSLAGKTATLPPRGQQAFVTTALGGGSTARYVASSNPTRDLQGMIVVGDLGLRRRDGIGSRPSSGQLLYIPEVLMSRDSGTFLQLINREARSGTVDLELYDGESRRPAQWSTTIGPSGSLQGRVSDFFGFTDGFQGYIKVLSTVDLSGIAVSAGTEWISTAPTMIPKNARTWTAPHIFADQHEGDTWIQIVNTSLLNAFGDLTIYDDSGQTVSSRRIFLPARQLTRMSASELFGGVLNIKGIISGSMVLTLEGNVPPPEVALVTYVTPKARTTVPLLSESLDDETFPQLAHSPDGRIFTGLAIFNPSTVAATITVEAYDTSGAKTAETTLQLAPKARMARLLGADELFGSDFDQTGGHIRIRSSHPVFSYVTFGDVDGETLSALEPQANP